MNTLLDVVDIDRAVRLFGAPARYMQGPGLFDQIGDCVADHGSRPLVVIDGGIVGILGARLDATMVAARLEHVVVPVNAPVTRANIASTVGRLPDTDRDVVVGIGGGKALDTAKGVAHQLSVPMVSVPTVASNDGPTARVFALYDDAGQLSELGHLPNNPATVLVDSEIIARAPIRFLISGIGDALAKKYEARSCARGRGMTTHGTRPLVIGEVVADGCAQVLLRDAPAAVADASAGKVTPAVENVVEAVILMSGIGYENGGLSLAHCMTRGLQVGRGSAGHLHGYHVAYGLLVQLALEDDPDRAVIRRFLKSIGLPTSLAELDMPEPSATEVAALASAAASAPHVANTWVDVSPERVAEAIEQVEREAANRA